MIITLISWLWIGITAFILGFFIISILKKTQRISNTDNLDFYILTGMLASTVYTQTFSIFGKIGILAALIQLIFCLIIIILYRRQLLSYFKSKFGNGFSLHIILISIFIILMIAFLASGPVIHYDTDLYHAQSIRWLEEFGLVPGLGNLHNRLAYNSSFFSLQALYSLSNVMPYSLHSLNGFFIVMFSLYSVTTLNIFHGKKLAASDIFKLGLIVYYCFGGVKAYVSSPGSDITTLSMVLYLCIKWCEISESKNEDNDTAIEYGLLALLALWTATIKLSAGLMIILALYPAVLLIKSKRWRTALNFVLAGFIILLPFLISNIILSGYLIYPYPAIDLFTFDWKIPTGAAAYDSLEIMAYGRGMLSHADYTAPFNVWFPVWYSELTLRYRLLVWINPLCLLTALIYLIIILKQKLLLFTANAVNSNIPYEVGVMHTNRKKRDLALAQLGIKKLVKQALCKNRIKYSRGTMAVNSKQKLLNSATASSLTLLFTCSVNLLFWFLTSPLIRYGMAYLILLPIFFTGIFFEKISKKHLGNLAAAAVLGITFISMIRHIDIQGQTPLLHPHDYTIKEHHTVEWEGIQMHLPAHDDRIGYHHFPSTTNLGRLDEITLRTGNLKDGFRVKTP